MPPLCFCHKQHLKPLYTPHKKWYSADLHHSCSPIQIKRVPAWFKMTIQYKMLRSNLMVSEPSELNIVYAVVQCTGHHMGKSGTKTLHVITPLKDVYKRNVVIKSSHPIGYSQCSDASHTHVASRQWSGLTNHWQSTAITIRPPINNNVMSTTDIIIRTISITTLMIIENRALWLARSFASSLYRRQQKNENWRQIV